MGDGPLCGDGPPCGVGDGPSCGVGDGPSCGVGDGPSCDDGPPCGVDDGPSCGDGGGGVGDGTCAYSVAALGELCAVCRGDQSAYPQQETPETVR